MRELLADELDSVTGAAHVAWDYAICGAGLIGLPLTAVPFFASIGGAATWVMGAASWANSCHTATQHATSSGRGGGGGGGGGGGSGKKKKETVVVKF